MFLKKIALVGAVSALMASTAYAGCGLTSGLVRILSNDFLRCMRLRQAPRPVQVAA